MFESDTAICSEQYKRNSKLTTEVVGDPDSDDGDFVGAADGAPVGATDGDAVVVAEDEDVGCVGWEIDGAIVVGFAVVGFAVVGTKVGSEVGGTDVGARDVGLDDVGDVVANE